MIRKGRFEEPFHKMPPDGPLPKLPNLYISDVNNLNFKKKLNKDYNLPSFEVERSNPSPIFEPFAVTNQNLLNGENSQIQILKLELVKSRQREQQLKDELLASAKIINEQDQLLQELRDELGESRRSRNTEARSPKEIFNYFDEFQRETHRLSAEADAILSDKINVDTPQKNIFTNESPSFDELDSPYHQENFLEGTFSPPGFYNPFNKQF